MHGEGTRVLLVNENSEDLSYYRVILRKMHCQVRTSSSFAKGAQCLEREHYDLIVLDQGSSSFEGRQVLMTAMEVDTEIPVLVLARSYSRGCYEEAMQSGALDYVEGRLSDAELVAFLETFVPRRTVFPRSSAHRPDGPTPGKNNEIKERATPVRLAKCPPLLSREHLQL
jgi:DNA-binding NtrC family response regulator